jgi:DNA-binding NarL/FixJ family response regulator
MNTKTIRIAIIHGNQLFRECLTCCLGQREAISVLHNASTLLQGAETIASCKPDLIVLDFGVLHGQRAYDLCELRALSSKVKILVIEVPETESDVFYCIEEAGASGYLRQNASVLELDNQIKAVMQGEALCSPRIASLAFYRMSSLARRLQEVGSVNVECLTKRETEIVALIEGGLSNKEIAVRLQIEVSTVKNHVHNVLDKLQLHDRRSAARYVKAQGLTSSHI